MRRMLLSCWCLSAFIALGAGDEPAREQHERNRRYVEKLAQEDPEQYQRLQRHARAFAALPADRQQQLLKLEQELNTSPPATQNRLQSVAVRYGEWLETLSEADRKKIKDASNKEAKLQVIREMREAEWLKDQPKALRDQIGALKGPERAALVTKTRKEEQERRRQWVFAARFWDELHGPRPMPVKLADFGPGLETYVTEYLQPRLSQEEKDRLEKAQGRWPDFPIALVEIADRHPPALPGNDGPKRFQDLPSDVRKLLSKGKKLAKEVVAPAILAKAPARWPEFGQAVVEYVKNTKTNPLPNEFLAYREQCLSLATKEFVDKKLWPILDEDDKRRVNNAQNEWPAYPLALQAAAQKHNLQVPWQTLPRGFEDLKRYRLKE